MESEKSARSRSLYIVVIIIVALVALGAALFYMVELRHVMSGASRFDGTYAIDDYTSYEFDGKGNGAMCLGNTTKYAFDYTVKDDTVTFDFEDDRVNDTTFTFTIADGVITLTQSDGASYTMEKK